MAGTGIRRVLHLAAASRSPRSPRKDAPMPPPADFVAMSTVPRSSAVHVKAVLPSGRPPPQREAPSLRSSDGTAAPVFHSALRAARHSLSPQASPQTGRQQSPLRARYDYDMRARDHGAMSDSGSPCASEEEELEEESESEKLFECYDEESSDGLEEDASATSFDDFPAPPSHQLRASRSTASQQYLSTVDLVAMDRAAAHAPAPSAQHIHALLARVEALRRSDSVRIIESPQRAQPVPPLPSPTQRNDDDGGARERAQLRLAVAKRRATVRTQRRATARAARLDAEDAHAPRATPRRRTPRRRTPCTGTATPRRARASTSAAAARSAARSASPRSASPQAPSPRSASSRTSSPQAPSPQAPSPRRSGLRGARRSPRR